PDLRELNLRNVAFDTAMAHALEAASQLAGLNTLSISRDEGVLTAPLGSAGAAMLSGSTHLRGLIQIELRNQDLRGLGAETFASNFFWPRLKRLGLRCNGIPSSA